MHIYDHKQHRYHSEDFVTGSISSEAIAEKKISIGRRDLLVIERRCHLHDADPTGEFEEEDKTYYIHVVIGYITGEGVINASQVSTIEVVPESDIPEVIRTLERNGIEVDERSFYRDKDFKDNEH